MVHSIFLVIPNLPKQTAGGGPSQFLLPDPTQPQTLTQILAPSNTHVPQAGVQANVENAIVQVQFPPARSKKIFLLFYF